MPLIRKTNSSGGGPAAVLPPFDAAALTAGTSEARWAAARAATTRPDGVVLLSAALAREQDPRVREAILTGLARIASADSAAAVAPYIRSDDPSLRTGAIDALRAMPLATAALLPALLADKDPDVRLLSCELARDQPAAEANRLLRELLDVEPEKNVCAAALDVVAETGGPEFLDTLARCARRFRDDPFLIFSIEVVRSRIGAQAADIRE